MIRQDVILALVRHFPRETCGCYGPADVEVSKGDTFLQGRWTLVVAAVLDRSVVFTNGLSVPIRSADRTSV